MKKIVLTSTMVFSLAIVATSGFKTSKHKSAKPRAISTSISFHNGNELAKAD